jgi:hypothetical protein
MSRFGYVESFSSTKSLQECRQVAQEAIFSIGCKQVESDNTDAIGNIGRGWAIRLIGGFIAPRSWCPVKVSVAVRDMGDHRNIAIRAEENIGFGSLAGFERKMRWRCDDVGKDLTQFLKHRLM